MAQQTSFEQSVSINCVVFSPDSKLLIVGLRDGTLTAWDVRNRREVCSWKGHQSAISSLVFTADGKILISAGGIDGTVKRWDMTNFQQEASFRLSMGWVISLMLSPDGKVLAVAGGSVHRLGEVKLLDSATGQEIKHFEVHANTVSAIAFADQGRTLIAGTTPPISPFTQRKHGEVYRWDVASGKELGPLP